MKKLFNILLVMLSCASVSCAATLPDTGCDVPGTVSLAIDKLAMWVGYAVGGYFAFLIVIKPLVFARKAFSAPKENSWKDSEEYKQYCRDNRV